MGYVVVNNTMTYLTVGEAARRLERSIEQVRRYLREGRLAGRRIGQQWFIEEAAVDDWPRRGRQVSEPTATYEAGTMKTGEMNKKGRLISDELIREIAETRDKIGREAGEFDVVALLREDREQH